MTAFSHLDPDFDSVFAIEAINEPIMDANQTPGFGTCKPARLHMPQRVFDDFPVQKQFVQVVRAVEYVLGVDSSLTLDINLDLSLNFTSALTSICDSPDLEDGVASALLDSVPVLNRMVHDYGDLSYFLGWHRPNRDALTTTFVIVVSSLTFLTMPFRFMDVNWQYNNPPNPADAKIGPQIYDNHLYYS